VIDGDVAAGRPAVVAFGANLGDRRATVLAAVRALAEADGVEVTAVSDVIETVALRPAGEDPDAPAYLNGVALLRSTLAPAELLALLHRIEDAHGRVRAERWGDRTLDLDLIDYDGMVSGGEPEVTEPEATERAGAERAAADRAPATGPVLPHPRAAEREFVLRPWLQLDPDAVIPGRGRVADLLAHLEAAR
jgi:2-amino-4-hydroxy-6-hydroxymethyldihydropteridine diphosphokinase